MMNEAPDLEHKKIALLTAIRGGRVITDGNATEDERMTINAMLDQYITKSRDPALASLVTNSLPTSPFSRKLSAVQAALGLTPDGRFGENSIMGIERAGGMDKASLADLLDELLAGAPAAQADTYRGGGLPAEVEAGLAADLRARMDAAGRGIEGGRIVGATGTGSTGVVVGPGPKVGMGSDVRAIVQPLGRIFAPATLARIKREAQAMQASGKDPTDFLRRELGAKSAEYGRMGADLLLASLGIRPAPK